MRLSTALVSASLAWLVPTLAAADDTRVIVTIENLAPQAGTSQTPFWVGFHEGVFDTYDGNTPASNDPQPGSVAMERICEDGNTQPITDDFAQLSFGTDATIPGPNGPLAPGDVARMSFVLDSQNPDTRFFSYASMILPSNDFCISNGNPQAHPVFDANGDFVAADFFVTGAEVLDAGTEVNDEIPANTAFFGQAAPNTGVDENGVIGTLGQDIPAIGFLPPGSGGILDDGRFRMADFLAPGYPAVKVSFSAAPAIVDDLDFAAKLDGRNEIPPVETRARGVGFYQLRDGGEQLDYQHWFRRLRSVTAAHLHLGNADENGPIIANLIPSDLGRREQRLLRFRLGGSLDSSDLTGPLAGQPLDALIAAIQAGDVYVNIHSERVPSGEIRGQVELRD